MHSEIEPLGRAGSAVTSHEGPVALAERRFLRRDPVLVPGSFKVWLELQDQRLLAAEELALGEEGESILTFDLRTLPSPC